MPSAQQHREKLVDLLKQLFQLDQPELDFGLYKIMHAKSEQVLRFLENDLLEEIEQAFESKDSVDAKQLKQQAREKLIESLGEDALDDKGSLQEAFKNIPAGKKYLEEVAAAEAAKDTVSAESEVYDHLYRFFERYYDGGDFMSRRYYARESDSRAVPYSVPYDGREVYLHWANKDQYYIKSSEYLSNYTFELNEAVRQEAERQKSKKGKKTKHSEAFDFDTEISDKPLKVHFRIVDASEGEHGNIKSVSDQKRFFIIHTEQPISIIPSPEGEGQGEGAFELIIQFQYRTDPEKTGQDKKWQDTRLQQAEESIVEALTADKTEVVYLKAFQQLAPTDKQKQRTLLGKYLQKYAARNTMDYFIHKDLGGFMHRELDFYIKNEIMRLDDIENADAPKVEQYLGKIRVLRRIAHQLITFLAQLEDFQKKLWLKKKFVTETNYCITLDRVPEKFYAEIAANDKQREEWIKLFAIDEIKAPDEQDLLGSDVVTYSKPLTVEFLKANPFLLIDTALFNEGFIQRVLAEIPDMDAQCDGVLIHSENFQALELMQEKYREQIKCIYIDPPYNTSASEIIYKNSYKNSSWLSLIQDRVTTSTSLLSCNAMHCFAIDDFEGARAQILLNAIFGIDCQLGIISIKNNPSGRSTAKGFSISHEYTLFHGANENVRIGRLSHSKEQLSRYKENDHIGAFEWVNFRKHGGANANRHARPKLFYPIFVKDNEVIFPELAWNELNKSWDVLSEVKDDWEIVFPTTPEGDEKTWKWGLESAKAEPSEFCVRLDQAGRTGIYKKARLNSEGTLPLTIWDKKEYSSTEYGTNLIKRMFGESEIFSFPKSIYAVIDCLRVSNFLKGHVLDYFGGSGTTAHATIELNRRDKGSRKYVISEMGVHFHSAMMPRIKKSAYSSEWKNGKPLSCDGISHCFKYLRLESYEDTFNNLALKSDTPREVVLNNNPIMQRDYLLNYFLDVETEGSQSLLNITDFRDPTAYKMLIKKPGSDESVLQNIDLIESFNWLIGLWVDHMAAPQCFTAEYERERDADLPEDRNTRLICKRLKTESKGDYWFRLIEGYTLKVPGDNTSKIPTLIVWRKQTDDAEKDNAVLQKYLMDKLDISPREQTYEVIYINGSHTLPNPVIEGEQTKVRLIEEAFFNAMWAGESA